MKSMSVIIITTDGNYTDIKIEGYGEALNIAELLISDNMEGGTV